MDHARENLQNVLASRRDELPTPIQMSDGPSRNLPKDLRVILANCLTHSRRKFGDVIQAFPVEVKYVVRCLKKVYRTDAEARKQLSSAKRLELHQEHSRPVMEDPRKWLQEQFDQRKSEPNSSLGGAISYMLKHWDELTLFLRVAASTRHIIWLDRDAAGWGWFVDRTPTANEEFQSSARGEELATISPEAADDIDLLTVLAHEIGHVVGADHKGDGLLAETLPVGVRRLTSPTDIDSVFIDLHL